MGLVKKDDLSSMFFLSEPDIVDQSGCHIEADAEDQSDRGTLNFLNWPSPHETQAWSFESQN